MPLRTSLHRKPPSGRWSGRSSKRRDVLSVNMISLPLADFRHVSHIGGGDAHADSFGDLSFLKMGHSLLLQSSQSEQNLFLACSPPPKPPRLNLDEAESEDPEDSPDWAAGRRHGSKKMSHSLPLLDSEDAGEEEDPVEVVFPRCRRADAGGAQQGHSPGRGSLSSGRDGDSTATCPEDAASRQEEDSSLSFSLDLGPSILDDVLQVMDKLHQYD